jgi:DNA polymerase I-like protein with 3'-5' exonuclease and polymerase domains
MLCADLSQVEGRVGLILTGDQLCIAEANTRPWEKDMHVSNAALVYELDEAVLAEAYRRGDPRAKEQRYIGKITVHGAWRDMAGKKLSETLLKDGVVRSASWCQERLEYFHYRKPQIRKWFAEVRKVGCRDKRLVNSFGRELCFQHERMDDENFRRMYSFYMQSEAADHMVKNGIKPVWNWLRGQAIDARLHWPVHDELMTSCYPEDAWDIANTIRTNLERIICLQPTNKPNIPPVGLSVPVTYKMGLTWKGSVEFDRLPATWEEFTDAAMRVAEG